MDIGTGSAIPKTGKESKSVFFCLLISCVLGIKPSSPVIQEEQQRQPQTQTILPAITHEHVVEHPHTEKATIPKRIRPATHLNMNRWNTSTHVKPNSYLPDLADAYPRDPFTKMPPKRDAIEVYRLLQSICYTRQ
jgi:hypothetical protein